MLGAALFQNNSFNYSLAKLARELNGHIRFIQHSLAGRNALIVLRYKE
jgi:hypothetical protein